MYIHTWAYIDARSSTHPTLSTSSYSYTLILPPLFVPPRIASSGHLWADEGTITPFGFPLRARGPDKRLITDLEQVSTRGLWVRDEIDTYSIVRGPPFGVFFFLLT